MPSSGDSPPPASASAVSVATFATPSTTLGFPSPNHNPNPNSTAAPASRRGLPPPCWTNEETLALIDSYREKWYSLRRGNLRAAHWEEVASAVAARSLHIPSSTHKTAVQCRHKIEKLRKRYRSERQRSLNHDPTVPPQSPWIFFEKMEQMENPNLKANANPGQIPPPHQGHQYRRYQESDDDGNDDDDMEPQFHSRPQIVVNGSGGAGAGLKFTIPRAVRTCRAVPISNPSPSFNKGFMKPRQEEMRMRLEAKRRKKEEEEDTGLGANGDIVTALRMLGDGYLRMEQMKMDIVREMEQATMEMELKRTEMILDMQRSIVDLFAKGIAGEKKVKRSLHS